MYLTLLKNRSNILASILSAPEVLEEAYKAATDAQGSAQQELDKYLDSLEGRITKLNNRVDEFWATFISEDILKSAIDGMTTMVELATSFVDVMGSIPTIIGTISAGMAVYKNFGRGKMFPLYFYQIMPNMYGFCRIRQFFIHSLWDIHRLNEQAICGELGTLIA